MDDRNTGQDPRGVRHPRLRSVKPCFKVSGPLGLHQDPSSSRPGCQVTGLTSPVDLTSGPNPSPRGRTRTPPGRRPRSLVEGKVGPPRDSHARGGEKRGYPTPVNAYVRPDRYGSSDSSSGRVGSESVNLLSSQSGREDGTPGRSEKGMTFDPLRSRGRGTCVCVDVCVCTRVGRLEVV